MLPLYGICLKPNDLGDNIIKILGDQEKSYDMNLVVYQNLLSEFNLTCDDCYAYFKSGIYPIDFKKFRDLTDNKISKDKKILQHMLNIDESKFDFQKFDIIIALIIT